MSHADAFYLPQDGDIEINAGRTTIDLRVANTGDRPIQVGSHAHFFETNRALQFDRASAFGMRLDIPSGTAVRFEPGDEKDVTLVAFAGERRATGMNGLVNGTTEGATALGAALLNAREAGFIDEESL